MNELRVPTVGLSLTIVLLDGTQLRGKVFLPSLSSHHAGAMRPDEWINETRAFFPFLPDGEQSSSLMNRDQILFVDYLREDAAVKDDSGFAKIRAVEVFCGRERLKGEVTIEMPEGSTRVLDYMNSNDAFFSLEDGSRTYLIRKSQVSQIRELSEE